MPITQHSKFAVEVSDCDGEMHWKHIVGDDKQRNK